MISVPAKSSRTVRLDQYLKAYLQRRKKELSKDYSDDVVELHRMRQHVIENLPPTQASLDALAKYYTHISYAAIHFPLAESNVSVPFTWTESTAPKRKLTVCNAKFECACVLFNIGAMYSQLAGVHDQSTDAGVKEANKLLCLSAGVFAQLRAREAAAVLSRTSADLTSDHLHLLETAMLAEAQACTFKLVVRRKMRADIVAGVAEQAAVFFRDAAALAQSSPARDRVTADRLHFEALHYAATADWWLSKGAKEFAEAEMRDHGKEISLLRASVAHCNAAVTFAAKRKTVPGPQVGVVEALARTVAGRLAQAEEDNRTIYMDPCPDRASLPAAKPDPRIQAKPRAVPDFADVAGEDMFADLVPAHIVSVAEAFKEQCEGEAKDVRGRAAAADAALNEQLSALGLPAAVQDSGAAGIPDPLWDRVFAVQQQGGADALLEAMSVNTALHGRVQTLMGQTRQALDAEAAEDDRMRRQHGAGWTRATSGEAAGGMRETVVRFEGMVEAAGRGNETVGRKMEEAWEHLTLLSGDRATLDATVPAADDAGAGAREKEALQALLGDLEGLVAARKAATADLASVASGRGVEVDLLRRGMEQKEVVFTEHREALDRSKRAVEASIQRQAEALGEVETVNARWRMARESGPQAEAREEALARVEGALARFSEIQAMTKEGADFFSDLETRVLSLHQTVADFGYTRNLEQKELAAELGQHKLIQGDEELARRLAQGDGNPTYPSAYPQGPSAAAYPPAPSHGASSAAPPPYTRGK